MLSGCPVVLVEEFELKGPEEALGDGIIEAVADGAHRAQQTGGAEPATECPRRVLRLVVAVGDGLTGWGLALQIPGGKMTTEQVKALVAALRDIVAVLADADPVARAAAYNDFGVALTYTPDGLVGVQAHPRGVEVRVGGGTCTLTPRAFGPGHFTAAA